MSCWGDEVLPRKQKFLPSRCSSSLVSFVVIFFRLSSRTPSAAWDLQRVIEADFESRPFLKPEIMIGEQSGDRARTGSCTRTDASAFASAFHRAGGCANAGTYRNGFDFVLRAHALALQFALFAGFFDRVITGDSGNRSDQRHVAVPGIDFIETEHHASVQSLLHRTDMSLDGLASGDDGAVAGHEIFRELRLEMFPCLQLACVEAIIEAYKETRTFRNRIGRSLRRYSGILRT
jgi:hypothetical protein